MSGKEKIEQDYEVFDQAVEQMAKEEIERIRKKANQIKLEAEKIGEQVEASINADQDEGASKKS